MTTTFADPVLVTGGTGRIGARLARRLSSRHVPVRIGTRNSQSPFDWHRASWAPAFHGVRSAYLCYSPDLAFPGAPELMADFAGAAADAGVQRLVLLSGRGEDGALAAEDAMRASGLEWTVLRCAWFAQNFSEGIPVEEAEPLAGLFTEILDGRNATLTPDLGRALGRKPRDFATYAARTANTGVWAAPASRELR